MGSRTRKDEAVVLRSIRFGEADRILHLFTLDRGRVGAIAKGVRKTRSRFGARLEPFSHVDSSSTRAAASSHTVTRRRPRRSHQSLAGDPYRIGGRPHRARGRCCGSSSSMTRIRAPSTRSCASSTFSTSRRGRTRAPEPALDPLALSFQLKLLWLAGYLPHLAGCAPAARSGRSSASRPQAGGGSLRGLRDGRAASRPEGSRRPRPARAPAAEAGTRRSPEPGCREMPRRDRVALRVPRRLPHAHARSTVGLSPPRARLGFAARAAADLPGHDRGARALLGRATAA